MAKKIDFQSREKCLEREMEGTQWMDGVKDKKGCAVWNWGKKYHYWGHF